jgi:ABC-type lipoprotein release transport system permease subunit
MVNIMVVVYIYVMSSFVSHKFVNRYIAVGGQCTTKNTRGHVENQGKITPPLKPANRLSYVRPVTDHRVLGIQKVKFWGTFSVFGLCS